MEHLTDETLARLVDDAPSDEESAHLGRCERCSRHLAELREQIEALGRLPDLRPPPGDWAVLEARLVSEGLVEADGRLRSGLGHTPTWMKVAAAAALFVVGLGTGASLGSDPSVEAPVASDAFAPASTSYVTVDEAAEAVRLAERRYMDALVQYRQLIEAESGGVPDASIRIATLEYLAQAGQAALRQSPTDPFLNGMVASVMAEREATLRQVSSGSEETWY